MATIIEDYSPIYVGDVGTFFTPQFLHKDSTPFVLTGATISMKLQLVNDPNTVKVCAGTWTIDDAANGKAHYAWQAADVNTAGLWNVYVTVTIGGLPVHADFKELQILSAP